MMQRSSLFWRAVAAFLALPAVVAFFVPWLLRPEQAALEWWGLALIGVGTVLLLWCVRDFYVAGHGTLAPWAPPQKLVVVGLYRLTRNPMYVAVEVILCGWAVTYGSRALWIYAACVAVAFHLRVVFYEEPWLSRTHGDAWQAYRARVPRWLGWPRRLAHQERRPS
jgi:protein-S-isoprenylcysteine O-methyltransferase Ste14